MSENRAILDQLAGEFVEQLNGDGFTGRTIEHLHGGRYANKKKMEGASISQQSESTLPPIQNNTKQTPDESSMQAY